MNLPTREECQKIVNKSDAFYCTETEVEGFKVEMYDYRLASHNDFINNDAYELRGITFVEQLDGSWERFILMNKFFNVNQTNKWMYDDLKDKKIVRVQDKLDGSIISFIRFPNGKVRAKSKMSFTSDQAKMAQEIYNNNKKIRSLIETAFKDGFICIFELVSPDNQIVLEYSETKLVLLQMRNISTGEYASKELMVSYPNIWDLETSQDFTDFQIENVSLQYLLDEKETLERIEGWVVTFEDGQMAKIKTDWYLKLHGLIGPDAFKENILIEATVNNTIDDIISNIVDGAKKDRIIKLMEDTQHKFNHLVIEFKELRRKYFQDFAENRKDFAITHSKKRLFSYVIKTLNTSFRDVESVAEQSVKEFILKETNSLSKAKAWLES